MAINKILIVGNGVDLWVTALNLTQALEGSGVKLCVLVLPENDLSLVPAGVESLSPATQVFHEDHEINEAELLSKTDGTFTFAANFQGWTQENKSFLQTYDTYGVDFHGVKFHHFYTKYKKSLSLPSFDAFSLASMAASKGRFIHPERDEKSILSTLYYGLNVKSSLYAAYLKQKVLARGVEVFCDDFSGVIKTNSGAIDKVIVANGEMIDADFFVDCTGKQSLLLNELPNVESVSWLDVFPGNRISHMFEPCDDIPVVIDFLAKKNYWQSVQSIKGGKFYTTVFDGEQVSDEALAALMGKDCESMSFQNVSFGYKKQQWHKNVIAFGEAAVNLPPLLFTGVDILHRNIQDFLKLLPMSVDDNASAKEYNRIAQGRYEEVRDYYVCHFLHCDFKQTPKLSEALKHKLALFRDEGMLLPQDRALIPEPMWISLLMGFDSEPENYDFLVDRTNTQNISEKIKRIEKMFAQTAEKLPKHSAYLQRYLANVNG